MVQETPVGRLPLVSLPSTLVVSPDSRHVATISSIGAPQGPYRITLDGSEVRQHDGVASGSMMFSSDSGTLFYGARDGQAWSLFSIGRTQHKRGDYDALIGGTIAVNRDGSRTACDEAESVLFP